MRSIFALGILIALCTSANAAKVHHSKPRDVIVHPSQNEAVPPGGTSFPAVRPFLRSKIEILTRPTSGAVDGDGTSTCLLSLPAEAKIQ